MTGPSGLWVALEHNHKTCECRLCQRHRLGYHCERCGLLGWVSAGKNPESCPDCLRGGLLEVERRKRGILTLGRVRELAGTRRENDPAADIPLAEVRAAFRGERPMPTWAITAFKDIGMSAAQAAAALGFEDAARAQTPAPKPSPAALAVRPPQEPPPAPPWWAFWRKPVVHAVCLRGEHLWLCTSKGPRQPKASDELEQLLAWNGLPGGPDNRFGAWNWTRLSRVVRDAGGWIDLHPVPRTPLGTHF